MQQDPLGGDEIPVLVILLRQPVVLMCSVTARSSASDGEMTAIRTRPRMLMLFDLLECVAALQLVSIQISIHAG